MFCFVLFCFVPSPGLLKRTLLSRSKKKRLFLLLRMAGAIEQLPKSLSFLGSCRLRATCPRGGKLRAVFLKCSLKWAFKTTVIPVKDRMIELQGQISQGFSGELRQMIYPRQRPREAMASGLPETDPDLICEEHLPCPFFPLHRSLQ